MRSLISAPFGDVAMVITVAGAAPCATAAQPAAVNPAIRAPIPLLTRRLPDCTDDTLDEPLEWVRRGLDVRARRAPEPGRLLRIVPQVHDRRTQGLGIAALD